MTTPIVEPRQAARLARKTRWPQAYLHQLIAATPKAGEFEVEVDSEVMALRLAAALKRKIKTLAMIAALPPRPERALKLVVSVRGRKVALWWLLDPIVEGRV